jgi:hypothetical protein
LTLVMENLRSQPYDATGATIVVSRPMESVRLVGSSSRPVRVILCKRVIASSSLVCHESSCGVGSLVLPLLAMAELRGQLGASRSIVRTSNAHIASLQARVAIVEARAANKPLAPLLILPRFSGMLRLIFCLRAGQDSELVELRREIDSVTQSVHAHWATHL